MATKNISLSEDAYQILASLRQNEKESFSEVVRRMKKKVKLSDFHGIISKESANQLEENIEKIREINRRQHKERIKKLKEMFL
ncbi:MAG: antitoxin VapB family protein [Nanoarchaeota archaeon]